MARKMQLAVAIAALIVGALTSSAGAAQSTARQAGPCAQVPTDDRPARAYNQPQMLVDPKDPNILVIAGANYNAGNCGVWVSRDDGRTWSAGKGSARPPQYATCVHSDLGPFLGAAFAADASLVRVSAAANYGGQED